MPITRQMVAERISDYRRGQRMLAEVVAWAEEALREGEFEERDFTVIRDVIGGLGLADATAFGLTWEDAVGMLAQRGYRAQVEIQSVRV